MESQPALGRGQYCLDVDRMVRPVPVLLALVLGAASRLGNQGFKTVDDLRPRISAQRKRYLFHRIRHGLVTGQVESLIAVIAP